MKQVLSIKGYSITIEGDTVSILHKPGDSFERALAQHQQLLGYLRSEGYFNKPTPKISKTKIVLLSLVRRLFRRILGA